MGNIRPHGRGWQLIYQVAGQRHWETVRVESESEALRILKIREGKALDPQKPPELPQPVTFEDLADDLKREYEVMARRDAKSLPARIRHLASYFTGWRANSITTVEIRAYVEKRRSEGAANGTINRELAVLKRMFSLAIRASRLYRKPEIPMLPEAPPRRGFFDPGQFTRVLAALPEHLRPVTEFAYFTGWRRGEITALQWNQVDLEQGTLRLWAGTTKNGDGRVLPLEGRVLSIIREQHAKRVNGCPWVFHYDNQRILTFYKAWKEACEKAGCPGMLFHDLRRTAARNFRRAGLSEAEAMAITGHKTPTVFRRYSIIGESDLRVAVRRRRVFRALPSVPKVCQAAAGAL